MELVLSLGYKSGEQITQLHKLSDRLFIPHLHRESIRLQFPTSGIRVAPSLHLSFRLLGLGSVSATWHVIYPYQNCSTDYTQQSHHGKIIVAYQANKRHAYEIRRFVAVLTTAHHWTLFCYTQIQSTPQHITSLRFLLLYRPACPLLWFCNHKHFFVNRYELWQLLITYFFPPHCCFLRLRSKYFPQNTIFKRPYKTTGKPRKRKVLHLCRSQHTCYVLNHVIHTGYPKCNGDCVHHQVKDKGVP